MEIERKYRIAALPEHYRSYPVRAIEQAYLCTDPVVRVRRDGGEYYLTYKGRGLLAREEYNLPLNEQAYKHLLEKEHHTRWKNHRGLHSCFFEKFLQTFKMDFRHL